MEHKTSDAEHQKTWTKYHNPKETPPVTTERSGNDYVPYLHKYNPRNGDKLEQLHCWRWGLFGYISTMCSLPPPDKDGKTPIARAPTSVSQNEKEKPEQATRKTENTSNKTAAKPPNQKEQRSTVNCISKASTVNLTLIPATVDNKITLTSLCDPGSTVTRMRECFAPPNAIVHPWQDGPAEVAGGEITPTGWITLQITVASIDYIMPKVTLPKKYLQHKFWVLTG